MIYNICTIFPEYEGGGAGTLASYKIKHTKEGNLVKRIKTITIIIITENKQANVIIWVACHRQLFE